MNIMFSMNTIMSLINRCIFLINRYIFIKKCAFNLLFFIYSLWIIFNEKFEANLVTIYIFPLIT